MTTDNHNLAQGKDEPKAMGAFGGVFSIMSIKNHEFERIRVLVHDYFGIKLSSEKRMLVVGRLQNYLKINHFDNFNDYIDHVESDSSGKELLHLIDLISTNHTFFFREPSHFDFFNSTILPGIELRAALKKSKNVRLWCAGCSGGDEAYSLMICLKEYFGHEYKTWNAGVLATDISEKILNEARTGIYSANRISDVPLIFRERYFRNAGHGLYHINDSIKAEVTFRRLNLKNNQFPFKHAFDMISCRNVMIYFDSDMKEQLVNNFYALTQPGGYLFVGHSETLNRKKLPYIYVQPGIYRKANS
ncbi:MAG: protein-glutamate O-methyltransferase CheR [Proteobacteria bacterium]|nr:protein-glutamate O-methyltransferase CheR [Pseudomonadota bacterium]